MSTNVKFICRYNHQEFYFEVNQNTPFRYIHELIYQRLNLNNAQYIIVDEDGNFMDSNLTIGQLKIRHNEVLILKKL